jgi:NAD(P)-dependent dehydrogenase (short-subunit alcohol dehydrogenase family)
VISWRNAFAPPIRRSAGSTSWSTTPGCYVAGAVDEIDEATWDECLETNHQAAYLASREAIPRMRRVHGGVIVNNAPTPASSPAPAIRSTAPPRQA